MRSSKKINSSKEKMVAPKIDISSGTITYPLLNEINESEDNIEFLKKLSASSADVLEKTVYEKIIGIICRCSRKNCI